MYGIRIGRGEVDQVQYTVFLTNDSVEIVEC